MINLTQRQKSILGDISIAFGIMALAWLLKDGSEQQQTNGMLVVLAAVLIRFQSLKFLRCKKEK